MPLRFQPTRVATGSMDEEGLLVLADERLVAVLVRLSGEEHGELIGAWFLEAGFGQCASIQPPTFTTLEEAETWLEHCAQRHLEIGVEK